MSKVFSCECTPDDSSQKKLLNASLNETMRIGHLLM